MAVNLGNGFIEIYPRWDRIDRRSVQRHMDQLNPELKVGLDDREVTRSVSRIGGLLDRLTKRPVGLTVDTKRFVGDAEAAVARVGRNVETGLAGAGERAARKLAEQVAKGVDEAQKDVERLKRETVRAEEAKARAVEKREAALRRVRTAEMNLYETSNRDTRTRTQKLRAEEQLKNAMDQSARAARELDRLTREELYYKRDLVKAEETLATRVVEKEAAEARVTAEIQRQRRLANNPVVMRVNTLFEKAPFAPIVSKAATAGREAGMNFAAAMNQQIEASRAAREARGPGMMKSTKDFVKSAAPMAAGFGGAALVGGSFRLGSDYEFQLDAIQAVSTASQEEMKQISDLAMKLGADTKYSTLESAGAIEELVKAGLSVKDVVGGVGKATVDLAAAGDVEVRRAAEISSNVKNIFNIPADQMNHVMDTIAGAANASSINVEQFAESMQMLGTVAKQGGMSLEDTAIAIAEMGNVGIKGSDAGTSLKTFMVNMDPTTTRAANVMEQYGLMGLRKKEAAAALAQDGITGLPAEYTKKGKLKKEAQPINLESVSAMRESLGTYFKKMDGSTKAAADEKAGHYMAKNGLVDSAFYSREGQFLGLRNAQAKMSAALGKLPDQERIQASKQIFGTDAMRSSGMMLGNGAAVYDSTKALINRGSAKGIAETRQGNFKSSMEQLGGSVENVRIKATLGLMGPLAVAARVATRAVNSLGNSGPRINKMVDDINKRFPNAGTQLSRLADGAYKVGKGVGRAFMDLGVPALKLFTGFLLGVVLPNVSSAFAFLGRHSKALERVLVTIGVLLIPWAAKVLAMRTAIALVVGVIRTFQAVMFVARSAALGFRVAMFAVNLVVGAGKWAWSIAQMVAHRGAQALGTAASWAFRGAQLAVNAAITAGKWAWAIAQMALHKGAQILGAAATWGYVVAQRALNTAIVLAQWGASAAKVMAYRGAKMLATASTWAFHAAQVAANAAVAGGKWLWSIAMMAAHKGAQVLSTGATMAFTAAQKAANLAMKMNPIGIVITLLIALGVALVTAYKKNETFRRIVNNSWNTVKEGISSAWTYLRERVFSPLHGWFTKTLPEAADKTQAGISTAWQKVKKAAANPVLFIVKDLYQEGIRGSLGKIPGVNLPDATPIINKLQGRKDGGVIEGRFDPANRDNVLGWSAALNRPIVRVEPGEHITNRQATQASPRLLSMINAGRLSDRDWANLPGRQTGGVAPVPGRGNPHPHSRYPWTTWAGDFPVPMGTPIHAWKDGVVAAVQQLMRNGQFVSYGKVTKINHTDGTASLYAHQSSQQVNAGQRVTAGQMIGLVGSTGNSSGPHLHFETKGGGFANTGGSGDGMHGPSPDDFLSSIRGVIAKVNQLPEKFPGWGGLLKGGVMNVVEVAKKLGLSKIQSMVSDTGSVISSQLSSTLGRGSVQDQVRAVAAQYGGFSLNGWAGGNQWDALNWIINHESSWNPSAKNPSSTARGLFQLLYEPGTSIPYGVHDVKTQARDGLDYIKGRYGNPVAAMEFWKSHNWYSKGTMSAMPGLARIDENGDEWINFRGGERVLPHGVEPKMGPVRLVGAEMRITNWEEGIVELTGDLVEEMNWRASR